MTTSAPVVTVPVLSRIKVSRAVAASRKSASLIRMFFRAATESAATIAAGPATTSAVGAATTKTVMARCADSVKNSVVAAIVRMTGT